jgi:hypothetical protein
VRGVVSEAPGLARLRGPERRTSRRNVSGERRPYSVLLETCAAGLVGRSAGRRMFLARSSRTPHATAESTSAVVRLPPTLTTRSGGGRIAAARRGEAQWGCEAAMCGRMRQCVQHAEQRTCATANSARTRECLVQLYRTTLQHAASGTVSSVRRGLFSSNRRRVRGPHRTPSTLRPRARRAARAAAAKPQSREARVRAADAAGACCRPRPRCRRHRRIRRRQASRFIRRRTCLQVRSSAASVSLRAALLGVRFACRVVSPDAPTSQASRARLACRRGRTGRCRLRGRGRPAAFLRRATQGLRRRRTRPRTSVRFRRSWTTT